MGTNRFCYGGLVLCLCLVFSSITARCQPVYGGITAYSGVNLAGNNVTMDSFNSADPNHSIWQTGLTYHGMPYGIYSDSLSYDTNEPPSRTADFLLGTDGSIINVGAANIYGYVNTAPGGDVSIQQNGSVGDLNWVYNGMLGIESGHAETNMNVVFPSKQLPNPTANGWQSNWLTIPSPPSGTVINIGGTWTNSAGTWELVGGTFYTNSGSGFTIPSPGGGLAATYSSVITNCIQNTNYVYYSINQLNQNLFVDAPNVVLYLTNGIPLTASTQFTLNSNADVSIYTSGNIIIGGKARFSNGSENAHALSIYDIAGYSNLAFTFDGNFGPAFIYAPGSSVSFSGGGASSYDFIGAIFCTNLTVNGHYNFHYDESLGGVSLPVAPWIVQQPTNQIVQAGSDATFGIVAGGSPLTYQWYFSQDLATNLISDATNAFLTLTDAQPADAGNYSVVVSDAFGSVTSSLAGLTVYTNASATLSAAFNPTNGQFQFNVTGVTGLNYTVEASTNLSDWFPVWTNVAPFGYVESNLELYPERYYRAVFVP